VLHAFADVRTAITTHVAPTQQTGLLQQLTTAQDRYVSSTVPGSPPILPPSPITPVVQLVLALDTKVQALSCAQQPGGPPITPAGVVAVRASITILLERLIPRVGRRFSQPSPARPPSGPLGQSYDRARSDDSADGNHTFVAGGTTICVGRNRQDLAKGVLACASSAPALATAQRPWQPAVSRMSTVRARRG
jgi:hypothetical protein